MTFDDLLGNPANEGVIARAWRQHGQGYDVDVKNFEPEEFGYGMGGGHPDISERVAQLGELVGQNHLFYVGGTLAFVHASTGRILSFIMGTAYGLRLHRGAYDEAIAAGGDTIIRWNTGEPTDLTTFGPGWVRGSWHDNEPRWIAETLTALDG